MLADIILIIHFLFVGFVIAGLLLIFFGAWRRWRWIRNFWFRILHLCAIGLVAGESLLGIVCPLTTWENQLRSKNGGAYQTSFIQHWVHKIIFYDAPEYLFTIIYVIFTLVVIATLVWIRPNRPFGSAKL
ncbi:DUF2784 domain-containing protein [bacterium]|nr:DUF2784 domain-containing protein [bacterium]